MKSLYIALCITFCLDVKRVFGAEVGMPQLNPEFWTAQIFWLILIFFTLYIIIWKIFLPKITVSIENRKSRVINDLNETQKLKDNAEKKLQEYIKIIQNSKNEAKKIVTENKKKLDKDIENKKLKFNEEIEKELLNVEKEIQNLKINSTLNINKIATQISGEMIKQIIGTEINASNVTAVVEDVSKRKVAENQ